MPPPSDPTYRYVQVDTRRYVCLQQNPLICVWMLYRKDGTIARSRSGIKDRLHRLKRSLHDATLLFRYQRRLPPDVAPIDLPFPGQICLKLRWGGYKVFDLQQGTVIKAFPPATGLDLVKQEIQRVQVAAATGIGPPIFHWNVQGRWYEEALVRGCRLPRQGPHITDPYENVWPMFARLIQARPAKQVDLLAYGRTQSDAIKSFIQSPELTDVPADKLEAIRDFTDALLTRLAATGKRCIYLVLSHGDLGLSNVFQTPSGTTAIDWEWSDLRSLQSDLHTAYFHYLWSHGEGAVPIGGPDRAREYLRAKLATHAPYLAKELAPAPLLPEVYRWTCYLEYLARSVTLGRAVTLLPADEIVESLLQILSGFERYEQLLRASVANPQAISFPWSKNAC